MTWAVKAAATPSSPSATAAASRSAVSFRTLAESVFEKGLGFAHAERTGRCFEWGKPDWPRADRNRKGGGLHLGAIGKTAGTGAGQPCRPGGAAGETPPRRAVSFGRVDVETVLEFEPHDVDHADCAAAVTPRIQAKYHIVRSPCQ